METSFWFGWAWMGLGMAAVLLVLLFCTPYLRGNLQVSRWKDPQWLAWLAAPMYMVHQFEEYALNITDGQYDIVSTFYSPESPIAKLGDMDLPLVHFPLMNIIFVWLAVPLGAWLFGKKNPAAALAPFGFILTNGLLHVVMSAAGVKPIAENPGFWTGLLVFLPVVCWIFIASIKGKMISGKALAIALVSGFLGHILLGTCYFFALAKLPAGTLAMDIVTSFAPMLLALLFCKWFKVKE